MAHEPGESVVISPVIRSHGIGVVKGVRGKVSSGASGCRISYRNSGIIGTVIYCGEIFKIVGQKLPIFAIYLNFDLLHHAHATPTIYAHCTEGNKVLFSLQLAKLENVSNLVSPHLMLLNVDRVLTILHPIFCVCSSLNSIACQ